MAGTFPASLVVRGGHVTPSGPMRQKDESSWEGFFSLPTLISFTPLLPDFGYCHVRKWCLEHLGQRGLPWAGAGAVVGGNNCRTRALRTGCNLGLGHLWPAASDDSCSPLGGAGGISLPSLEAKNIVGGLAQAATRESRLGPSLLGPEIRMSFRKQSSLEGLGKWGFYF